MSFITKVTTGTPYVLALAIELMKLELSLQVEVPLEVSDEGRDLGLAYVMDLAVDDLVVVESISTSPC